jgi:hypothetical protein
VKPGAGTDFLGLTVVGKLHAQPTRDHIHDLLVGMSMLHRALVFLERESSELDRVSGDELSECGRILRSHVLLLDLVEVNEGHDASRIS